MRQHAATSIFSCSPHTFLYAVTDSHPELGQLSARLQLPESAGAQEVLQALVERLQSLQGSGDTPLSEQPLGFSTSGALTSWGTCAAWHCGLTAMCAHR